MKVLITNIEMIHRSGTTLYVRDLALELLRQGHEPEVYTLGKGVAADALSDAGIPVVTSLRQVRKVPDVIHGHHNLVTRAALRYFVHTPAIFICHDHTSIFDEPPLHERILAYFAVSRVCYDRVRNSGIPEENINLLKNFVDTQRFLPRPALPHKPHRALLFSNYAHDTTQLPVVKEACRIAGLELDVVGLGVGRPVEKPEEILGSYDIVFAKAKAAMEAMAVGTAVILCDFSGAGPMVTSSDFATLQPYNFGFQALRNPLKPEFLVEQIERYNAEDARMVRDLLRVTHRLDQAVQQLVSAYRQVVDDFILTEDSETSAKNILRETLLIWLLKTKFLLGRHTSFPRNIPGFGILKNIYRTTSVKILNAG
jgi:hypothetical protein